ncbi:Hypothetical predicted protein [Lecanosticta acicola]|uniref:Uncharacterized protein n=1 Tax=Lecanosticta acicola TaxID=111012 RepID=A0AAI9EDB4_9PEZI|nr:Hypothetical predicted protein [Lecanosticta acicola]
MFGPGFTTVALTALLGVSSAASLQLRDYPQGTSNVTIVDQSKNYNATGGEGHVAAAGNLPPFGSIGIGCGVNWDNKSMAYGGGVNAGSKDFGLGGGYTVTPTTIEIGNGIGINTANSSANVNFKGSVNGTFELRFESTSDFACVPSNDNGTHSIVCTTI